MVMQLLLGLGASSAYAIREGGLCQKIGKLKFHNESKKRGYYQRNRGQVMIGY
jgi:hypothetical protein